MATFHGYIRRDGSDYQIVVSEVDVEDISGGQEGSIRILERDASTTLLELSALNLNLRTTDSYLPGGNVFQSTITEAQYNTILPVTSFNRVDSGTIIDYIYQDQVELFLGPSFETTAITNTDTTELPYIDSDDVLVVDHDGTYEYRVTDHTDNMTVLCETIDINDAVSLSLDAPANYDSGTTFDIVLSAVDQDGTITTASLTDNGVEVLTANQVASLIANGTLTISDYSATGNAVLIFSAIDNSGHTASVTHTVSINNTTITVMYVDGTGSNATLNNTTMFTMAGVPGEAWTAPSKTVTRIDATTRLDTVTCSETGDTGDNVNCTSTGTSATSRAVQTSGTFPLTNTAVILTIEATVDTLADRNCSFGSPQYSGGGNGGFFDFTPNFAGGGTFSASAGGQVDSFGTSTVTFSRDGGRTSGPSGTRVGGASSAGFGSYENFSLSFSVGESATHRSCSVSTRVFG